jgi:low temperature requirement protein LtrA
VAVAIFGLALTAELFWTYFGGDEVEAERTLLSTRPDRRGFLNVNGAYFWAHLLILLGIIAVAAALEHAIGHAFDPLSFALALSLAGGAALFLLGSTLFRWFLGLPFRPWRVVAAVLALATIPLGTDASALAQLIAIDVALGLCLVAEGEPDLGVESGSYTPTVP